MSFDNSFVFVHINVRLVGPGGGVILGMINLLLLVVFTVNLSLYL